MAASAQYAGVFIAFFALGATFLGTALLLLLNAGSRDVRWYAAFNLVLMFWLGTQGTLVLTAGGSADVQRAYFIAISLLPGFFLGASLAGATSLWRGRWEGWSAAVPYVPVLAGVLLALWNPAAPGWVVGWHVVGWSAAAGLHLVRVWRGRGRRSGARTGTRGEKQLELVLAVLVPIGIAGAVLTGDGFVLYVLPLMSTAALLLVFVGIVQHRFYDIEVRAARAGELATGAGEQERLALLGELAATVAHEVRNPLTGMRSLTQMIADQPLDDERRRKYADVILGEIARLDRMASNLTALARRTSSSRDTPLLVTPLGALFEDLALLAEPRARRSGVRLHCDPTTLAVLAPRDALAQALLNLLVNAIAHARPSGTVRLMAVQDGGRADLLVRDDGPGVPPAERNIIFDAFHSSGGTGLGLAVVRRLGEEYGWTVGVGDAPGGGAEFRIGVPLEPQHA